MLIIYEMQPQYLNCGFTFTFTYPIRKQKLSHFIELLILVGALKRLH